MKAPTFRGKPSDAHVIWRRSSAGGGADKTFDEELLRKWCGKYGADYETDRRVDHERSPDPREQYRCVFHWTEDEGESFSMGDDEWEIQAQKTPRTFVEIDEAGVMRVQSWDADRVVDVAELRVDGASLVFRPEDEDSEKRLDAGKLTSRP